MVLFQQFVKDHTLPTPGVSRALSNLFVFTLFTGEITENKEGIIVFSSGQIGPTAIHSFTFVNSAIIPAVSQIGFRQTALEFNKLVEGWKEARNPYSSLSIDNFLIPQYQRIVGMGPPAISLILAEIKKELAGGEPDDWFGALWAITGETPVAEHDRGNIMKIALAWLHWGKQLSYQHADSHASPFASLSSPFFLCGSQQANW